MSTFYGLLAVFALCLFWVAAIVYYLCLVAVTALLHGEWLAIAATTVVVAVHVYVESQEGLATYLYQRCGRSPAPAWVGTGLTLGALALTFGPLAAWWWTQSLWWATWLSAAIATDVVSTHLLPTLISREESPGMTTWVLQVAAALCWGFVGGSGHWLAVLLGVGSFVSVWPTVFVLSRLTPTVETYE